MRDPIYRAFSEWSMFSLGWNWDPIKNFSGSMATQAQQLQRCNASLYMRPDTLAKLPTAELAAYITKCFGGGKAMACMPQGPNPRLTNPRRGRPATHTLAPRLGQM